MRVRVIYALPERQTELLVELPQGATVADAIARAALIDRFPELGQQTIECAIFSRPVAVTSVLNDGDRVEILRPLRVDPKENRRNAAAASRPGARRTPRQ